MRETADLEMLGSSLHLHAQKLAAKNKPFSFSDLFYHTAAADIWLLVLGPDRLRKFLRLSKLKNNL